MSRLLHRCVGLFIAIALATAQDKVKVAAHFVPATAKPGDEVVLEVALTIAPGWHVYGRKDDECAKLAARNTGGLVAAGEPDFPDGERHEAYGLVNYWVVGSPVLKQRYRVPGDAKEGEVEYGGSLDYMVCNESSCLPPAKAPVHARLKIGAAAPSDQATGKQQPEKQEASKHESAPAPVDAAGAEPDAKDLLKVSARVEPAVAHPGERAQLIVTVEVAPQWHTYGSLETTGVPITMRVDGADKLAGVAVRGAPEIPPGAEHDAYGGTIHEHWLQGKFEIAQQLAVAADAAPGERALAGAVPYTVCNESTCLPATELPIAAKFAVEAGAARPEFTGAAARPANDAANGAATAAAPAGMGETGLLLLLLSCVGAGLFALAMPCTYPMIPITFSFFTKQAEQRHGKVLPLALVYGLGIVTICVVVGVALSDVIIGIANYWAVNAVIFVAFVAFAAALFGWINLQPPQFLQRAAGNASRTGGYLGVFFMGATLVLTSFTCTGPIVASLLAGIASVGKARVGFGMGVFGLTMALPFVVLALVPTRVKQLPRSGEWMETLKVSLGFVEFAASFKFLSMVDIALGWQLLPRELFLMLCATVVALWALYLFGILRKAGTANDGAGSGRMASGMLVSLLAAYLFFGALGNRLDFLLTTFVPPYSAVPVQHASTTRGGAEEPPYALVRDDAPAAVALAKREGKLLLYNFTGFN
jgi:thiol:disulfide interchange protein DsbD